MSDRIALKRLTQSDLTFVDYHFQNRTFGESRQKAINLNVDVFIDQLFPDLLRQPKARIDVLLTVYGPGGAGAFVPPIPRRPILNNNSKNWRLNGKTLPDDPDDPERFQNLRPDDLAVFDFRGWPAPTEIDLTFVSSIEDAGTHAALSGLVATTGKNSMVQITRRQLDISLSALNLPAAHPLSSMTEEDEEALDEAEEEIIRGRPINDLLKRRRGGSRVTPEQLEQARTNAARIGADGEAIVFAWLRNEENSGRISNVDWISQRDAAAPFDFTFIENGTEVRMDAKATKGSHDRKLHLSIGEVIEAAQNGKGPYRIARLSLIDEDGGILRISEDVRDASLAILDGLSGLPSGVEADGFSIYPHTIVFGDPLRVERPAPEND